MFLEVKVLISMTIDELYRLWTASKPEQKNKARRVRASTTCNRMREFVPYAVQGICPFADSHPNGGQRDVRVARN